MTLTTPSINCSKYNNVSYWQVEINGIQVMRRQSDNYFNATHVLKLALYTKPTRTRIVDREIYSANITHEKVQGGYALIQGTWLTMDFTIALARKHHVLNLLLPIINIDTSLTYPERPPSSPKKLHAPRTRTEFKPVISPRPQQAVSPSKKYAHLERNTPSPFRHLLSPHLSPKVLSMKPVDLPSSLRKREIMLSILNGDDGLKVINLLREPDSDPKSFDINYAVDNDSNSALHLASNMAKIGIVKTLLDHGVNTTFCNTWGETALMTSVLQSNNYQVQTFAKLLILLHPTL